MQSSSRSVSRHGVKSAKSLGHGADTPFPDWKPRYDVLDSRLRDDAAAFDEWWTNMRAATLEHGTPIQYQQDTGRLLGEAGFTEIRHEERRVCIVAAWDDLVGREIAEAFRAAMGDAGTKPWSGFSMELFTRYRGYHPAQVDELDARLVRAVSRYSVHVPFYWNLLVCSQARV